MLELYLLPYAGGSSLSYSRWHFDDCIKVVPLDYKGHGTRMKEPLAETFADVIDDIYEQIEKLTEGSDISIFGHSMGSLVAWDVAVKLLEAGRKVQNLFISACVPPHKFNFNYYNALTTKDGLVEFLRKGNRVSEHQINSSVFNEIVCPASINDYRLLSLYRRDTWKKELFRITCLYGLQDDIVNVDDLKGWKEYTSTKCVLRGFEGSHYYIEDDENLFGIERIINQQMLS